MKDLKKLKLPRWVRKRVAHKEEDNDISAFVVGVMALYCVFVIAYFAYAPFGSKYLGYQVIITCTLLVIIAYVSCWFVRQFTMLRSYRQEAIICRDKADNEEVKQEAIKRLEYLCIPVDAKL